MRKLTIDGEIWRWAHSGERTRYVLIVAPTGKTHRVKTEEFLEACEKINDAKYSMQHRCYSITPGKIKHYIQNEL